MSWPGYGYNDDPTAPGFSTLRPAPSPAGQLAMGPTARRLFQLFGLVAAVGVVLALAVPLLNLRSGDCGPLNCGFVQVVGKVAASVGVGAALGTVAFVALRAGRITAAVLAALIAGPALLWSVFIVDQWQQLMAGTDQVTVMVSTARDYAARQEGLPSDSLHALLTTGRGDWAVVKIQRPDGAVSYALLERGENGWVPRAIGPSFSRDELRALGAPTDLMRDAAG